MNYRLPQDTICVYVNWKNHHETSKVNIFKLQWSMTEDKEAFKIKLFILIYTPNIPLCYVLWDNELPCNPFVKGSKGYFLFVFFFWWHVSYSLPKCPQDRVEEFTQGNSHGTHWVCYVKYIKHKYGNF